MNPNITLDQQPPGPSFLSTPLQPLVQFPSSDGIAFVKQEADAVEAMESYPEEVLAEYEVECILEKEIQRGKVYYLVKWKGFDLDHATWEPRTNLKNAPEMLKEFEKNWRDAQHAAQVEALNNRTRKAATSAVAKMKNQDSGNKSSLRKREKLQPETSTNGLVVTIKKVTKDQNQEVFSFDEQAGEEAKMVEKENENTKKKKVKETNKKVKLNPESAQGKKKGKNNQITVKSENIFDPRDLMSHQMFMSMQKSGLLDGSIMGFHPDLSAQNILDSIKKENIDSITPSPFMAINMTHFTHQAISAGTRENSSSNNNSQGFVSGENGYSHHDLVDNRIGINIHAKPHESENNFTALARGMERQRLMDCSDSQQESDDSSLEASDSESVQDTDMEGATVSPYGSLENGDIPIKVIGVRPLIEENDLEIMMAWKPRPNGEKPEDSRVKRFDLLKRGLILPLIEYYEQNMQLGSAPSFNASLLAKKTV